MSTRGVTVRHRNLGKWVRMNCKQKEIELRCHGNVSVCKHHFRKDDVLRVTGHFDDENSTPIPQVKRRCYSNIPIRKISTFITANYNSILRIPYKEAQEIGG
ncbi:unnamed protein product [Larinioides sclopetarius]|uniref:THAP-type domain-containing protein n=1 Tax=Larinioides sclopetarius TaxID=280406 RepID=A0AAV2BNP9_9ARAC